MILTFICLYVMQSQFTTLRYKEINYGVYGSEYDPYFKVADICIILGYKDLSSVKPSLYLQTQANDGKKELALMITFTNARDLVKVKEPLFEATLLRRFQFAEGRSLSLSVHEATVDIERSVIRQPHDLHSLPSLDYTIKRINAIDLVRDKYLIAFQAYRYWQYAVSNIYHNFRSANLYVDSDMTTTLNCNVYKLWSLIKQFRNDIIALNRKAAAEAKAKADAEAKAKADAEAAAKLNASQNAIIDARIRANLADCIMERSPPCANAKFLDAFSLGPRKVYTMDDEDEEILRLYISEHSYDRKNICFEYTRMWIANYAPGFNTTHEYYERYARIFKEDAVNKLGFDNIMYGEGYNIVVRDNKLCWDIRA